MEKDLQDPRIIKILDDPINAPYKNGLIDCVKEIPRSLFADTTYIHTVLSNNPISKREIFSDWNIPYLIELNNVNRPLFSITTEDIIKTMTDDEKSGANKIRYFYMIYRHHKRHS